MTSYLTGYEWNSCTCFRNLRGLKAFGFGFMNQWTEVVQIFVDYTGILSKILQNVSRPTMKHSRKTKSKKSKFTNIRVSSAFVKWVRIPERRVIRSAAKFCVWFSSSHSRPRESAQKFDGIVWRLLINPEPTIYAVPCNSAIGACSRVLRGPLKSSARKRPRRRTVWSTHHVRQIGYCSTCDRCPGLSCRYIKNYFDRRDVNFKIFVNSRPKQDWAKTWKLSQAVCHCWQLQRFTSHICWSY